MSVLTTNLNALKEYRPQIYRKIVNRTDSNKYVIDNQVTPGYSNIANIEKVEYYYNANPIEDVNNQLKKFNINFSRMVCFLGVGLGYEIYEYAKSYAQKNSTVSYIIVEKEIDIFCRMLENIDVTNLIKSNMCLFIIGQDSNDVFSELYDFFKKMPMIFFVKTLEYIYMPVNLKWFKEYYFDCIKSIKDAVKYAFSIFGNDPTDSLIGLQNMISNIDEIIESPGINLLRNAFADKPAVVVSAGPSLNKNIHLLQGIKNKVVIIAADTSFKILMKNGIKPHFIVSHERTESTVRLLDGFNAEEVSDIFLAACPVIPNKTYKAYPGPKVIVYREFKHFNWLQIDKGTLASKHSAGNMAFKLADSLGCNPIILIGQDLAFGDDGLTHASGAVSGEKQDYYSKVEHIKVKGNYKEEITTTSTWYRFLKGYEKDVSEYRGKCINCTEGGAFINGTEVMKFEDVINRDVNILNEFSVSSIIENKTKDFYDSLTKETDLDRIKSIIEDTIYSLKKPIELCKTGQKIVESFMIENDLKEYTLEESINVLSQVLKLKEDIVKNNIYFDQLVMHICQSYFIQFEIQENYLPKEYAGKELIQKHIRRYREWFERIRGFIDTVLTEIEKAQSYLEADIDE